MKIQDFDLTGISEKHLYRLQCVLEDLMLDGEGKCPRWVDSLHGALMLDAALKERTEQSDAKSDQLSYEELDTDESYYRVEEILSQERIDRGMDYRLAHPDEYLD